MTPTRSGSYMLRSVEKSGVTDIYFPIGDPVAEISWFIQSKYEDKALPETKTSKFHVDMRKDSPTYGQIFDRHPDKPHAFCWTSIRTILYKWVKKYQKENSIHQVSENINELACLLGSTLDLTNPELETILDKIRTPSVVYDIAVAQNLQHPDNSDN